MSITSRALNYIRFRSRASCFLVGALLFSLIAAGCADNGPGAAASPASPDGAENGTAGNSAVATDPSLPPPPAATATTAVPTATPEPLAARVNGEPIYLAAFEEMLARQQQGQAMIGGGDGAAGGDEAVVLDALIERALIGQEAARLGIQVSAEQVDQELARLRDLAGGAENYQAWLVANQMTEETFREELAYELLVQEVVLVVTDSVPYAVEQVRARYIWLNDLAIANDLHEQLEAGANFATLAQQYSLDQATGQDGGDLGYFAAGVLLVPEIEEAAFGLQPGAFSDVITGAGPDGSAPAYYLVQVVEVDPARPLAPELRSDLVQEEFASWLESLWLQADIERFITPGA